MLHHVNEKNLGTKEIIVMSQDYPKFLGSPVTCGSQRVKVYNKRSIEMNGGSTMNTKYS